MCLFKHVYCLAHTDTAHSLKMMRGVVDAGVSPEDALKSLEAQHVCPPLLAKPLYANGLAEGHRMALIHDLEGVAHLVAGTGLPGFAPPVMLQPYVDHGGCLFKVWPCRGLVWCWDVASLYNHILPAVNYIYFL
jgi:hypothetical protein